MNDEPFYVTAEGLARLKAELKERTEIKRLEIADRLDKAIKMGDLKENADYHVAKEDQGFNEGRVQYLQNAILNAVLIKETTGARVVRIGTTVTIAEVEFEDEAEAYQIVGAAEADPTSGRISNESPIGRALIGARVGDVVEASTPGGTIKFKVLKIA